MKHYLIKTFGCQMNKDDSERIAGLMTAGGYTETQSTGNADVVIFNTCCVRQHADHRAYGQVGALKQLKLERPDVIIAVGGCLAQLDGPSIQKTFPHIDIVFGTHNVSRLPALLREVEDGKKSACEVLPGSGEFAGDLRAERRHRWHAWLPITVGCDNFCTYCIVPYVRGREKSRKLESLVAEGERLAADGVVEITLLGQNVNSYGRDLYGKPHFTELLDRISAIRGLRRIRFTTSHPKDVTSATIELIAERNNLCPHFHLPVQAGSDRILRLMKRKYTAAHYLGLVREIREKVADVAITTDIMVGFPGESESDFEQTLAVVREARFDQAYTFIYSPRPGTAAAKYENPVPAAEKSAWFSRLVEVQKQISLEENRRLIDGRQVVFVEALSKREPFRLAARTPANRLVHLNGGDGLIGQSLPVRITEAFSHFLLAEATEL